MFQWHNSIFTEPILKGKNTYSIGRMVHCKNWKRQTKCYNDHKQIHKIPDNPWKNKRKITRPWSYHTFIYRHSNPISSFFVAFSKGHTKKWLHNRQAGLLKVASSNSCMKMKLKHIIFFNLKSFENWFKIVIVWW